MRKSENKHEILVALVLTLKRTREYDHLIDMTLERNSSGDYVYCQFADHNNVRVDVTADSGAGMIRDIMRKLEEEI